MSLANLLRIGQLKEHPADVGEIARLLSAAERCVADALRRKRNLADYTGEDIDEASVAACIDAATRLLHEAEERLAR